MNKSRFLCGVMQETGIGRIAEAERATGIVFQVLGMRMTPEEADDLRAQLPDDMQVLWEGNWFSRFLRYLSQYQLQYRSKEAMYAEVARRFQQHRIDASVEKIITAVFRLLKEQISEGETIDVAAQLPNDIQQVWSAA